MGSSMVVSTAAVARASPAQADMVAPFTSLRSSAAFPVTRRPNADPTTLPSNGGRVQVHAANYGTCSALTGGDKHRSSPAIIGPNKEVRPPEGKKKFETLPYLPDLSDAALAKEVDYLLRKKWIPCLEFSKVEYSIQCKLKEFVHEGE